MDDYARPRGPSVNALLGIRSLRDEVPPAEWQARVDLAACYRLVALYGMAEQIANHISVRVPGAENEFLINAYGLMYEEITASSLIRVDLGGNVLYKPDFEYGVNKAGFVIHGAIHGARADAHCIIHTHTPAGMAVSAMKCGLLPMTQTAMRFGKIGYHDYEGVVLDMSERERLLDDIGEAEVLILRNHGLLVTGRSIPEAFSNIVRLERACQAQVMALAANTEIVLPSAEVVKLTNYQYLPTTRRPFGVLEWPALLRQLDRRDPSYRE